jgi:hypothetical protein
MQHAYSPTEIHMTCTRNDQGSTPWPFACRSIEMSLLEMGLPMLPALDGQRVTRRLIATPLVWRTAA